jgi:hypothetical protein
MPQKPQLEICHRELKLSVVKQVLEHAHTCSDRVVALWLDELTVYRLPSTARACGQRQGRAPKTHHTAGTNDDLRIAGALNTQTGQVTKRMAQKMGVRQLQAFYHPIRRDYPNAEQLFVIQDCWLVHFQPQVSQTAHPLGIWFVPLPTYASWRNPIEKLWRWLKQTERNVAGALHTPASLGRLVVKANPNFQATELDNIAIR